MFRQASAEVVESGIFRHADRSRLTANQLPLLAEMRVVTASFEVR